MESVFDSSSLSVLLAAFLNSTVVAPVGSLSALVTGPFTVGTLWEEAGKCESRKRARPGDIHNSLCSWPSAGGSRDV